MADARGERYELYYWPTIQGRGEFVRLAFEEAGVPYVDVGRQSEDEGGDEDAVMRVLEEKGRGPRPFALPALMVGDFVVSQTAAILHWVAPRIGVAPADDDGRAWALAIQLTIADAVTEVHDSHHPIASGLYYEDQRPEARRRAQDVIKRRLPKFLGHLESALRENPAGTDYLVGDRLSYVDLSLFQLLSGLDYAFPHAMKHLAARIPLSVALQKRIAARPRIAAYLASPRRIPFNQDGIFRHYPELDEGR
jgi:glutathione S-transferase